MREKESCYLVECSPQFPRQSLSCAGYLKAKNKEWTNEKINFKFFAIELFQGPAA